MAHPYSKNLISMALVISAAVARGQTVHTPIQDFVNAQTNFLIWTDPPHDREFFVDFAGLANEVLMNNGFPDLGTSQSGSVTQRPAPGGRLVHVDLHADSCLCYARQLSAPNAMYFGYRISEMIADPTLTPAIGSGHFTAEWTDSLPVGSSTMPDMIQLLLLTALNQHIVRATFEGDAFGSLRAGFGVDEGTPGIVKTTQIGLINSPQNTIGGFNGYASTEDINIKVVGG